MQLLAAVADGDRKALDGLMQRHAGWLVLRLSQRSDDSGLVVENVQNIPTERVTAIARRVQTRLDTPRPTPVERFLQAVGVPTHLARLLAATPSLTLSWLAAVGFVLAVAVVATHWGWQPQEPMDPRAQGLLDQRAIPRRRGDVARRPGHRRDRPDSEMADLLLRDWERWTDPSTTSAELQQAFDLDEPRTLDERLAAAGLTRNDRAEHALDPASWGFGRPEMPACA